MIDTIIHSSCFVIVEFHLDNQGSSHIDQTLLNSADLSIRRDQEEASLNADDQPGAGNGEQEPRTGPLILQDPKLGELQAEFQSKWHN